MIIVLYYSVITIFCIDVRNIAEAIEQTERHMNRTRDTTIKIMNNI